MLDIQARDSGRAAAVLVRAEDAGLLDTSGNGVDDAVQAAIEAVGTAAGGGPALSPAEPLKIHRSISSSNVNQSREP